MMLISVVNRSKTISDEQLQQAVRAINRQIAEDFEPYWGFGGSLRVEGAIGGQPDKQSLADMRGDAVLYLWDGTDVDDALGYHQANFRGIPYGFIFIGLCKQLGESWTVTLSHEALELIGDSQANLLVQGPHPTDRKREVFHWFEMCDAVQSDTYEIDAVAVSNFLLPLYFTPGDEEGGRNDFLGRLAKGQSLRSFGVRPGGYIGFYDPAARGHDTYVAPDDKKAQKRMKLKAAVLAGRSFFRKAASATTSRDAAHRQVLGATKAAAPAAKPKKKK